MAYSLTSSNAIVSEGATLTITLGNTGLPDGTLVPFAISGTNITTYDFLSTSLLTGNFRIRGGIASITLIPALDLKTEGTETFLLRLTGPGRTESIGISILDTSTQSNATAQFYITASPQSLDEGSSVVFTVRGENVPAGTLVPYQFYGIQAADVFNTPLSGNLIFASNSSYDTVASVGLLTLEDHKTEGDENIALLIYPSFAYSLVVSGTSLLRDTSTAESAYLKITSNKTIVREGESITFTVEGVNLPVGSNISYQITPRPYFSSSGDIISPELSDFSNLTSFLGTFPPLANTGSANVASITLDIKDDKVFEPTEYFFLTALGSKQYKSVSSAIISILDSGNTLIQADKRTSGNVTVSFLEKAVLQANVGALTNKPGYWADTTGQISDSMVLQGKSLDATEESLALYQPFSYVIRSSLSIDKWKESVKTVLHPAGFALFSEINNETDPNYVNNVGVVITDDSEYYTYSIVTIDNTIGSFNASNVSNVSTADRVYLQTNPK